MKTQINFLLAKHLKREQEKKVKKKAKFPPQQYINLLIKYAT
jgi:hypothetical protein